jgi:hypothetical protein
VEIPAKMPENQRSGNKSANDRKLHSPLTMGSIVNMRLVHTIPL